MAQAKWEMIQDPFLAMQGDPRRFTSLREDPRLFLDMITGPYAERLNYGKRGEVGLLK